MDTLFKCAVILIAYCMVFLTSYVLLVRMAKAIVCRFSDPYTMHVVRRYEFTYKITGFERAKVKIIDELDRNTMKKLNDIYDIPNDRQHDQIKQELLAQEFYEYREALRALN